MTPLGTPSTLKSWLIQPENLGLFYGLIGVFSFSLTLPATRLAVAELDASFVGLGRGVVAALLAAISLGIKRQPLPTRQDWGSLGIVAAGVVLGFPLLSAWAMRQLPASHGGIILGILPLATALAGVWRNRERPSWLFWLAGLVGSGAVLTFAWLSGAGHWQWGDLLLLAAVAAAALGYAEGAKLSPHLGSWQVISWALVLSGPILGIPLLWLMASLSLAASWQAWLAFAYVSLVSQFLGFFAWYHGLALGGVARVGQIQLLQPFLTLGIAALFLGEPLTPLAVITGVVVLVSVAIGKQATIDRPSG
ncbi:MAG: DMT family transporter [Cyanobacteriota bacterium]|nr:DMT family transporter [Cyanobacteriota bacterium]